MVTRGQILRLLNSNDGCLVSFVFRFVLASRWMADGFARVLRFGEVLIWQGTGNME
jgi:hypothetical protein